MKILLFRGLFGDIFSTGMDDLAAKLVAGGHDATVHRWTERAIVERRILRQGKSGPFILIGHSLGANAAANLAGKLHAAGKTVALLVTLDPTNPCPLPQAIKAVNLKSSFVLARTMQNSRNISLPELSHTQLDNAQMVHEFVMQAVAGILPVGKKQANSTSKAVPPFEVYQGHNSILNSS